MFKIIPILMGVVISYGAALIMNACGMVNPDGSAILDFASVASAGWVGIPTFKICQFDVCHLCHCGGKLSGESRASQNAAG